MIRSWRWSAITHGLDALFCRMPSSVGCSLLKSEPQWFFFCLFASRGFGSRSIPAASLLWVDRKSVV